MFKQLLKKKSNFLKLKCFGKKTDVVQPAPLKMKIPEIDVIAASGITKNEGAEFKSESEL